MHFFVIYINFRYKMVLYASCLRVLYVPTSADTDVIYN